MKLINYGVQKLFASRYKEIDFFSEHPVEKQEQMLEKLLKTASNTEWGRQYGYKDIKDGADFGNKVPLNDYDSLKSSIERMIAGEENVLWPGAVKWFAKSSGTTSDKSKFIPVSDDSIKKTHMKSTFDVFATFIRKHPDTNVVHGKNLTIGGSHRVSTLSPKTRTGDLSAVLLSNLPPYSHFKNTPSSDIALIADFEEKVRRLIEVTRNQNITSFAGVPSWFLVMIKRLLNETGKETLLDVWPNLEVFAHGGVNFEPYREQYRKLIPTDRMHYINTYNASEGFFSIQTDLDRDDMQLMLDYEIYYEFIPMDEFHNENRHTISIGDVKTGVNYAMVISTNGGLWRYILGDTVMFTSTFPHHIKITGRTRHYINAFGEELIVDNAEKGLKLACEQTGAIISEYTAGPVFMSRDSKGCHQWIIEFEHEPDDIENFADILDKGLQSVNSDYEAKRFKDTTLMRLQLVNAPKGTFYEWMKMRGKVGGQNKIPRLANNREYLESLLEMLAKKA